MEDRSTLCIQPVEATKRRRDDAFWANRPGGDGLSSARDTAPSSQEQTQGHSMQRKGACPLPAELRTTTLLHPHLGVPLRCCCLYDTPTHPPPPVPRIRSSLVHSGTLE